MEIGVKVGSARPIGAARGEIAQFEDRNRQILHQAQAAPSRARKLSASAAIGPPRTAKAFDISEEPKSRDLTWASGSTPVRVPPRSATR